MSTNEALYLTNRERWLIMRALQIAIEDGSLYGSAETKRAMAHLESEVKEIERKLSVAKSG